MWNEILTEVFVATLTIITIIITRKLIPLINFNLAKKIIMELVLYAEQTLKGVRRGTEKYAKVAELAKSKYPKLFKDDELIDVLIESSVLKINEIKQELEK